MEISFSDGEWKLMRLLWEHSPLTIADMVESLRDDTGWSKNTIFVMLTRLEHKGAVAETEGKNPNGRAVRLYRPLVEKTPAAAKKPKASSTASGRQPSHARLLPRRRKETQ